MTSRLRVYPRKFGGSLRFLSTWLCLGLERLVFGVKVESSDFGFEGLESAFEGVGLGCLLLRFGVEVFDVQGVSL